MTMMVIKRSFMSFNPNEIRFLMLKINLRWFWKWRTLCEICVFSANNSLDVVRVPTTCHHYFSVNVTHLFVIVSYFYSDFVSCYDQLNGAPLHSLCLFVFRFLMPHRRFVFWFVNNFVFSGLPTVLIQLFQLDNNKKGALKLNWTFE